MAKVRKRPVEPTGVRQRELASGSIVEAWAYAELGAWEEVKRVLEAEVDSMALWGRSDRLQGLCLLGVATAHLVGPAAARDVVSRLREEDPEGLSPRDSLLRASVLASWLAEDGDPGEGLTLLRDAGFDGLGTGDDWVAIFSGLAAVKCLVRQGSAEDAKPLAARMAERARALGLLALRADASVALAMAALGTRSMAIAWAALSEAEALYRQVGDFTSASRVALSRGFHLAASGHLKGAIEAFEGVRGSFASVSDTTVAKALMGLGWAESRAGDPESGIAKLREAVRLLRGLGLSLEEATALEYLVEALILDGRSREAREVLETMRRDFGGVLESHADLSIEVALKDATLLVLEERYTDALGVATAALERAERLGLTWEVGSLLRVAGTALAHLGRCPEAYRRFQEASSCLEEVGEVLERALVCAWKESLEYACCSGVGVDDPPRKWTRGSHASEALVFWVENPAVGPLGWLEERVGEGAAARFLSPYPGASPEASAASTGLEQLVDVRVGFARETRLARLWTPADVWWRLGFRTRDPDALAALREVEEVAEERIPVLVLGPSGAGKELIAEGLHLLSRRHGLFLSINCASARGPVFAAELHGVRKGAFTDAKQDRKGCLEAADGGTIFLDEIADLGEKEQGLLLRFLDKGEVKRLGSVKAKRVDVRVVAATNRDLEGFVREGRFREDLYHRLAGATIRLPSLRERICDLDLLIQHLWEKSGGEPSSSGAFISRDIVDLISLREWPGNVRELLFEVGRAVSWWKRHGLEVALAKFLVVAGRGGTARRRGSEGPVKPAEMELALRVCRGSVGAAARVLGISRPHAYRLLDKFGLRDRSGAAVHTS